MKEPQSPQSVPHAADPGGEAARAGRAEGPGSIGAGGRGATRAVVDGDPAPRLPHERDESADDAGAASRPVIERARQDVAAGRQATDRSEATDELYARTLRGG